jgi:lysophospholipase L1-like esterase
MKYIFGAIAILLILLSLDTKKSNIKSLEHQETILAFGDSLTYGYNAKPDESYPVVLSHLSGLKVINAGISGERSDEALIRLPKILVDSHIKLMLLCLGANDILQGKPLADIKTNLKRMIEMAKAKDIDVLLISVPNLTLFGLSPLGLYEEVAEEENVSLLSGMLADILEKSSLKSDQIHPNALGYKIMAEKIYEKLKEEGWMKD